MLNIENANLNAQQIDAVKHVNGPLLVLAGAGTGKTRVLTYRIANIILSDLAVADEILAVTFTNKAAKEMKERLNVLVQNTVFTNVGTFHSICAKILRKEIENLNLGFTRYFTIINQEDQKRMFHTKISSKNNRRGT